MFLLLIHQLQLYLPSPRQPLSVEYDAAKAARADQLELVNMALETLALMLRETEVLPTRLNCLKVRRASSSCKYPLLDHGVFRRPGSMVVQSRVRCLGTKNLGWCETCSCPEVQVTPNWTRTRIACVHGLCESHDQLPAIWCHRKHSA